ncbi:hypothetical protein VYU27_005990 [Nannochloropsis oceanica]
MAVKITLPPGKQQQRHKQQPSPAPESPLLPSRRPFRVTPTTTRLDEVGTPTIQRPVSLQEMGQLLLQEKKTFGAALTGIGLASACQMCVPYIFGRVVDLLSASVGIGVSTAGASELVSNSVVMEGLRDNAMAMLGVGLVGTMATYASTAQLDIVGQRISMDLRKRLFSNILDQDLAFFDVNKSGELANRLSTDVHEVAEHLVENVSLFLSAAVMATGSAGMLLYISPSLSVVTLSVVPAMVLGAAQYSKIVKKLSLALLNSLAVSTQQAAEKMGAIRIVRHFAAEDREKERYGNIIDMSLGLARKLAVSEGVYVAAIFAVSNFALLGVLFLGAGMVVEGGLTVGGLASYCLYATNLSTAMKEATDGVAGIIRAQGAAGRLYALLETRPKMEKGTTIPPADAIRGRIEFKDVTFAYPTRPHHDVLKGFNLKLDPRENLGVTGPSGCGKSSLALLLTRMYAPQQGRVFLDGFDISTLDPSWLRRTVVVITQEPLLFSGTVRENIAYGMPDASEADITKAAQLSNAHRFITHLPQQYDTQIGERALVLSGGQKQRLAIARAILLKPRVLIVDEGTTALDYSNQQDVLKQLLGECCGSTVILIGHSATALEGSSRLVSLNRDGGIERDEMVGDAELPHVDSDRY